MDQLSAKDAARLLGIKRETLYAYVARGQLRSTGADRSHGHRYDRQDIERLLARKKARMGQGAVAAEAMRWGQPVLESSITDVSTGRLIYRGHDAAALARSGASFEAVCELLWSGTLVHTRPQWTRAHDLVSLLVEHLPAEAPPLKRMAFVVAALGLHDWTRLGEASAATHQAGRGLIPMLAACLGLARDPARIARAYKESSVSAVLLRALGRPRDRAAAVIVDQALVLAADHELNPSTFGARIAASAGADVYSCFGAALAVGSGPQHIGSPDRCEAFLRGIGRADRVSKVLKEAIRNGQRIPGFGHRLYPNGDPRVAPLLEAAADFAPRSAERRTIAALITQMADLGREPPAFDVALVAVAAALSLPTGGASAMFAVGRSAGWVAHIVEQRGSGEPLRPRARYVGRSDGGSNRQGR